MAYYFNLYIVLKYLSKPNAKPQRFFSQQPRCDRLKTLGRLASRCQHQQHCLGRKTQNLTADLSEAHQAFAGGGLD